MQEGKNKGLLYANRNIQTEFLKKALIDKTNLELEVLSLCSTSVTLDKLKQGAIDIIVVDYNKIVNNVNDVTAITYGNIHRKPEIIINCPTTLHASDITNWHNLFGVFYEQDDIDTLYKGVEQVINGKMWFSRRFSQDLIKLYRQQFKVKSRRARALLTSRECEILKYVALGKSNLEISKHLFVSENTVKAHLHHVFKKVNVRNRVEAMLWLKEYTDIIDEELA